MNQKKTRRSSPLDRQIRKDLPISNSGQSHYIVKPDTCQQLPLCLQTSRAKNQSARECNKRRFSIIKTHAFPITTA